MPDDEARAISIFLEEDPVIGMNQKQVKFVDMLILFRGDKGKAYKSAGYKVKSHEIARRNGSRLLKNARVQRLLAHRIEKARRAANLEIKQARVIRELNRLGFSSILDYASWDQGGANFQLRASHELSDDAAACIKKIENIKRVVESDGETRVVEERTRIELYDKKGPLEMLAKASKLVSDAKPATKVNLNFNLGKGRPDDDTLPKQALTKNTLPKH